jgi:hypothetical protein
MHDQRQIRLMLTQRFQQRPQGLYFAIPVNDAIVIAAVFYQFPILFMYHQRDMRRRVAFAHRS